MAAEFPRERLDSHLRHPSCQTAPAGVSRRHGPDATSGAATLVDPIGTIGPVGPADSVNNDQRHAVRCLNRECQRRIVRDGDIGVGADLLQIRFDGAGSVDDDGGTVNLVEAAETARLHVDRVGDFGPRRACRVGP